MAFVIADRVRESTTTTGTGAVTLAGAYVSFQSFAVAVGNGNNTYYTIASPTTGDWEVGIGTYSSGTNTLSRDTVLASSNSGSLVNLGAGSKDVFVTQPAERSLLVQNGGSGLFSGNSAFTANGVVYASSTSALTTGSALTFDGTNLGVGVSTAYAKLQVVGTIKVATGNAQGILGLGEGNGTSVNVGIWRGAANNPTSDGNYLNFGGYDGMVFAVGNAAIGSQSEQMRLTSTGLGIGTSSPSSKLDLVGVMQWQATAGTVLGKLTYSGGEPVVLANTGLGLRFFTNNTQAAVIDSSGNLGLGVTPSAWNSSLKALQVGSTGMMYYNGGNVGFGNNLYVNAGSNTTYITTAPASMLYQDTSGQFRFYQAASGTAGTTATLTQAMTLDASGKFMLGTTSTSYNAILYGSTSSIWQIANSTTGTGASNGLTIGLDGSANGVLIHQQAYPLLFGTSGTERARIDSSGNLFVGTTNTATGGLEFSPDYNSTASSAFIVGHASGSSSGAAYGLFRYGAATIGSITQNGTTAVLYNTTSDQRLKENIVDAPEFGSVIDAIQVRSYDWKADHTHQRAGFIAQELVTVAPEAVHQPADPEEMMAVDYSKLVPMLVKEIQQLRARVAQLETQKG